MELNEYQKIALTTSIYPEKYKFYYPSVGLCEEAGEVAGQIKRLIRDDGGELTPERREKLILELGDCAWYISVLANDLGVTLEEVAKRNLEKLASRKARNKIHGAGDSR